MSGEDSSLGIADSHWVVYLCRYLVRAKGVGVFKIPVEMAKWANNSKTNKPRALMMSLSVDWMFLLSPLHKVKGGQTSWALVCFHYCPCRFYLQPLDTALFFYFKRIKKAPDMSIPTRGIEKHLACRLPGLPPRMSVSDEGEKNDALYRNCKKPFIQPQLGYRECTALTHGG